MASRTYTSGGTVTVSNNAFGGGVDTILVDNNTTTTNAILLGGSGDTATIGAATIGGRIAVGAGNDVVIIDSDRTLAGSTTEIQDDGGFSITLGTGNDTLSIAGNVSTTSDILGADGADAITIDTIGTIGGIVDGGAGNDTITLENGMFQAVDGGDDTDTITINGGSYAGTISGGLGSDAFTVSDGFTGNIVIDGNEDADDSDMDTLNLSNLIGTLVYNDGDPESGVFTITATGQTITFNNIENVICFTEGTLIETLNGPQTVETLEKWDLIYTKDNSYKPLMWIGRRHISYETLLRNPAIRPVRIRAGVLGAGVPSSDLIVSPQHRILIRSKIAKRMFGQQEVLIAAKHLMDLAGVDSILPKSGISYWHFLFDQHEIVLANGAEAESLYTGSMALDAMTKEARTEVLELFPELTAMHTKPARQSVGGKRGHHMVLRHERNEIPLNQPVGAKEINPEPKTYS